LSISILSIFLLRNFFDKLKNHLTRPVNSPIGPVPAFNPDIAPLLSSNTLKRSKDNFYIPTEAEYTDMLSHLLVVAYGTAEAVAHSTASKADRYLAGQSLFSLAHVFERLTDFRKRNWFRELPGSLRYASLLSDLPSHGEYLFSERSGPSQEPKLLPVQEVLEHCDKAREQYKKLKTSTYVFLSWFGGGGYHAQSPPRGAAWFRSGGGGAVVILL
jgi:hypothetical protein